MKIAVITANFGGFDTVKQLPEQDIDFDRYYFTEQNSPYPFHTIDSRLRAKVFKIMCHKVLPDYDMYVWLDGNVQVNSPSLVSMLVNSCEDFVIQKHPDRSTIYEEAEFIIGGIENNYRYLKARYNPEAIKKEIDWIGPGLTGLYACGIFARRNTPEINAACEQWYLDNVLFANFDQIAFVNRVHKHNLKVATIDFGGTFHNNDFVSLIAHSKIA